MKVRERLTRVRVRLAGKLLDLAESLPETKRGPIHHLQVLRGFQRQHAAEPARSSRPPEGNHLTLACLRLHEAYPIEYFERLRRAIQTLFPDLSRQSGHRDVLHELDESIRSLNADGWWKIGVLGLGLARGAFSEDFTARHTRAVYRLTVTVLVLTLIQVLSIKDVRTWIVATFEALWSASSLGGS